MRWGGTLVVSVLGCYNPTLGAGDGGPPADGSSGGDAADPDGGTMPRCGSTAMLRDDFEDGSPAPFWVVDTIGPGTVIEGSGYVTAGGAPDMANTWGYYLSDRYFDFRGSQVTIEVPQMVNLAAPSQAYFAIRHELAQPFNTIFDMTQELGDLHFRSWTNTTPIDIFPAVAYDPSGQRFWRIRDDAGLTRFETSPNGNDWTSHGDTPTPDWAQAVAVEFGAGAVSAHSAPGEAHFDNLNGGGPTSFVWCPPNSLVDDFDDGVRAAAWKGSYASASCTVDETGGVTELQIGAGTGSCALRTALTYDLRGADVLVEVPRSVDGDLERWAYLRVSAGPSSYEIRQGEGTIFVHRIDAAPSNFGVRPYTLEADRWWRIRETGGMIHFETAPDAGTWTTLFMEVPIIPLDAVHVELGGVATGSAFITTATVRFDRYNLPAP